MSQDKEAREMIATFKKQYPEYKDVDVCVEIKDGERTCKYIISPASDPTFSVTYYRPKPRDDNYDELQEEESE